MTARLLPWALALVVSVVLAVVLIPSEHLFSDQPLRAVGAHDWGGYEEALSYLVGILALAVAGGVIGGWALGASASGFRLNTTLRFLTNALSLGGFSPLQAALLFPIWTVLVSNVDWIDGSEWLARIVGIVLLGLPLSAELALRVDDSPGAGWIGRLRSAAATLQEQAPALAGRLLWVAFGGILLILVIVRQRQDAEVEVIGELPAELLLVSVVAVLIAFLIWLASGLVRTGRFDASIEPDSADPEQCRVTQPSRPLLLWGLVVAVVLWPLVMSLIAGDPRPLSLPANQAPGDAMLPWTTDWGSTRQGQSLHAVLYHAWGGAVEAGVIAAALAATAGVFWRFGSAYLSRRVRGVTETAIFRIPPVLLFLAPAGLIILYWRQALDFQTVGVAIALVLLPQSLRLMRIDCGKMPTTIACQVLLGTLLALGWSSVGLQFLGFMSPVDPSFDSVLMGPMSSEQERAGWVLHRGLAMLLGAAGLNLLALGALVRSYNLPRELTRLRG